MAVRARRGGRPFQTAVVCLFAREQRRAEAFRFAGFVAVIGARRAGGGTVLFARSLIRVATTIALDALRPVKTWVVVKIAAETRAFLIARHVIDRAVVRTVFRAPGTNLIVGRSNLDRVVARITCR